MLDQLLKALQEEGARLIDAGITLEEAEEKFKGHQDKMIRLSEALWILVDYDMDRS